MTNPRKCCRYLFPTVSADIYKGCVEKCKNEYKDCVNDCAYDGMRFFDDNNKFEIEMVVKSFIDFSNVDNVFKETWSEIVRESAKKCEQIVLSKKSAEVMNDKNKLSSTVLTCALKENFINCPNFQTNDECMSLKNYVENCKFCCNTNAEAPDSTFWYQK
ncbi:hypothetical protein PVAND_004615 [Polypedilum vanderplanki]|uniref:Uncharacterized protein n=1 Tax=Polypedilum vanderplanki TaxID=319348 RepID=A0A9J6BZM3_POLVA|nr:hypothetical protein PVAND_004615 [Polypedilum vanderplanki]